MASQLISLAFDDPTTEKARAFARHLRELVSLDKADLNRCLAALPEFQLTRTSTQERELLDRVSLECVAERPQVHHAISILSFFADGLLSDEILDDDYQLWVSDLIERELLDSDQSDNLQVILRRLVRDFLPSLRGLTEEQLTAGGVLPSFKVLGYTVEVRPIRKQIYRWGRDVDKYQPQILRTVQIASIHIGVDAGPVKDIYFQADGVALNNMISTLKAAKKDMAAFGQFLGLADDTEDKSNA